MLTASCSCSISITPSASAVRAGIEDCPRLLHMSAVFSGTRKDTMKATQRLHDLGQSLWLDNISREILDDGTLRRYIEEFSVTGLTSNPTIFDEAIGSGDTYDESIRTLAAEGKTGEALFVELALEDLATRGRSLQADLRLDRPNRRLGFDGAVAAAGR